MRVILAVLVAGLVGTQAPEQTSEAPSTPTPVPTLAPRKFILPPAPEQPLAYSHKVHIAQGLDCTSCHEFPEPGRAATFPPTATCTTCHEPVKPDVPALVKLGEFAKSAEPIPWKRVYKLPVIVPFDHKVHVTKAAIPCEGCHGAIAELEVMQQIKDISMVSCIDCHRDRGIPADDCGGCHEPM